MPSPIYFFTRSGCVWCQKMLPSIHSINKTLNKEQKIEIHSIDNIASKKVYESVIRMNQLQNIIPLMYNSNIGTTSLGYQDEINIKKFLKAETLKDKHPIKPIPKFDIENSTQKDFDFWKKSVILWYEDNKNKLPDKVIPKERMIDMVYKQFFAYRTKPKNFDDRLSLLEEKVEKILKKIS